MLDGERPVIYGDGEQSRGFTYIENAVKANILAAEGDVTGEAPADSPTPYERYVLSEDYEFRASTLQYDKATDEFYFHITTRKYDDDESEVSEDTGHQTVLGIDLGVNSLAVASTGTFWQGDEYDHWCREFERRRGEMQQRGHASRAQRGSSPRKA